MTSDLPPIPPPPPPPQDPAADWIPFEQPGVPFFSALIETVKLFIVAPVRAFQRVPVRAEFVRPLIYAVILGTVGSLIGFLWDSAVGDLTSRWIPQQQTGFENVEGMEFLSGLDVLSQHSALSVLFAPFLAAFGLFVGAALTHLFLMLVGGNMRGFFGTLRVVAYSSTSNLSAIIPLCGPFLGILWTLALSIIGLSEVHQITKGKATLAVLLPFVLFCGCCAIFAVTVGLLGRS